MDLSIVTVTYNAKDHIAEQIRSVQAAGVGLAIEHIIIDNASTDGTVALLEKQFPHIRLVQNSRNRGFAKANNQGAELAAAPFLFFLNPDMKFVGSGSLNTFVDWMKKHPKVGIAGCRLTKPDGSLNPDAMPRRFPRLWDLFLLTFKIPHVLPGVLNHYQMKDFDATKEQVVNSVRGSCLLMRRELVGQLGFAFDPRYFIWFEDVDVCREAKRLGWDVVYTPVISCVDYVGQSFKKQNLWWKQKEFLRSMGKYVWKWGQRKGNDYV